MYIDIISNNKNKEEFDYKFDLGTAPQHLGF